MGSSNVMQEPVHFREFLSTNSAAFDVDVLLETFGEVGSAVVTIEMSSSGECFVITETTGGEISGSSWDGRRLGPG